MSTRVYWCTVLVVLGTTACSGRRTSRPDTLTATPVLTIDFENGSDTSQGRPGGFQWNDRTSQSAAQLDSTAHDGRWSLRLSQQVPGSAASVRYVVPDTLWKGAAGLDLSGWIRTVDVRGGWAGLWIRADGADRVAADSLPPARRPPPLALDFMREQGATGTSGWKEYSTNIRVPVGTRRIVIGVVLVGTGTAWTDEIGLSAQRALAPPSQAALSYARAALDSMQAHVLHSGSVPWDSLRHALPSALIGAAGPRDTYAALEVIARRVNRHSELLSPEMTAALGRTTGDTTRLPPLATPERRLLSGRVGYIEVPAYVGVETARSTKYADALQSALGALDRAGACAFIVDLRRNEGGNMYPMIAGIGPLLGPGKLGAFVSDTGTDGSWSYRSGAAIGNDGGRDTVLARVTHPLTLRDPAAPVALLIGPSTASAAEALAISFRGRPATRFFGQPTAGLTTGNAPLLLSDGAGINLTVSADADRTGRVYESPIEPDVTIPRTAPARSLQADPVVRAAMEWSGSQPGCSGTHR